MISTLTLATIQYYMRTFLRVDEKGRQMVTEKYSHKEILKAQCTCMTQLRNMPFVANCLEMV